MDCRFIRLFTYKMKESSEYWISNKIFVFKPNFNKSICPYLKLIATCNKLVFSNYNNFNTDIDDTNNFPEKCLENYVGSIFNKSIVQFSESLTHLTFGEHFNQSVSRCFPQSLTHLTFGDNYNKPVSGFLPRNLTHLTFGNEFNQSVNELPPNLTHLKFGASFNHPVSGFLPNNLTHLTFGERFNQPVSGFLPENLTHLTFGERFNQPVSGFLPENLTHLELGYSFSNEINELPGIKYLYVGTSCTKNLLDNLPNSIEELKLGDFFNQSLDNLPNQLKKISWLNDVFDKELNNLPESVEHIELPIRYYKKISKLPKNLKTIKCARGYKFIDDFVNYKVQTY
jgi:hypothetical protein